MRFMVMIKADGDYEAGRPPSQALTDALGKHTIEMMEAGVVLEVGGLLPSSRGARLRVAAGTVDVTDGPFSEAKELIGGFAIIKAESMDDAIRITRQFFQIHVDVLGPSYEGEAEIRLMFDPGGPCGGSES
jgi:hypothetical protein